MSIAIDGGEPSISQLLCAAKRKLQAVAFGGWFVFIGELDWVWRRNHDRVMRVKMGHELQNLSGIAPDVSSDLMSLHEPIASHP